MTTPNTVYLTYNSYITQIASLAAYQTQTVSSVVQLFDGNGAILNNVVPQMINYAELRIQRDLDLDQSLTNNSSLSLTSGTNTLTMDLNSFITVQDISYVSGTKTVPIFPASKFFIQQLYPDSSVQGAPLYFCPYGGDSSTTGATSQLFLFGPTPDQSYPLSINGTVRMISLNSFNTTGPAATSYTFISAYLPDLLLQASMIYLAEYQRNFGRASDDPQMAMTYEAQYQALLKGAMVEENRRKMWASAWTALSQPVNATANR